MKHKYTPDTFSYRMLNANNRVNGTLGKILKEATPVTAETLQLELAEIRRNYKFPLKFNVLDEVEKGHIKLFYSSNAKMPASMPFVIVGGSGNSVIPIVFLDLIGNKNKNEVINVETKKLYAVLESAYIAAKYTNKSDINIKTQIITEGSKMWAGIFTRPLNKAYALNTDKSKLDRVTFIAACFYLINILGLDPVKKKESIINYSIGACKNPNGVSLKSFYEEFTDKTNQTCCPFTDLETFIKRLVESNLGLKDLGVRNYLESYISMYGSTMLLSLEIFEYFAFNMISVMMGAYLNNEYAINSIVEDNLPKFYTALVDVM